MFVGRKLKPNKLDGNHVVVTLIELEFEEIHWCIY